MRRSLHLHRKYFYISYENPANNRGASARKIGISIDWARRIERVSRTTWKLIASYNIRTLLIHPHKHDFVIFFYSFIYFFVSRIQHRFCKGIYLHVSGDSIETKQIR